ncbi:hypothetical protein DHD05_06625 [Arenibacter sp. N53]|nr:hypothetical protein [Arenibacter sp. N53]
MWQFKSFENNSTKSWEKIPQCPRIHLSSPISSIIQTIPNKSSRYRHPNQKNNLKSLSYSFLVAKKKNHKCIKC